MSSSPKPTGSKPPSKRTWRSWAMVSDWKQQYDLLSIRKRLYLALQQLYLCDAYLIEQEIWECAISHRLAVYLEHKFPDWHVDCEFNKYGNDPKMAEKQRKSKRPDIIVHKRGKAGPNLLALEIKKKSEIDTDDRDKVKGYISKLQYTWGVCISVNTDGAVCEWQGDGISQLKLDKLTWANLEDIGYGE